LTEVSIFNIQYSPRGLYGRGGCGGGAIWRGGAQLLTAVQATPQSEASSSMVINLFFMMILFKRLIANGSDLFLLISPKEFIKLTSNL